MSYDIQPQVDLEFSKVFTVEDMRITGLQSLIPALPVGFYVQGGAGAATTHPIRVKLSDGTWAFVVNVTGRYIYSGGTWISLG